MKKLFASDAARKCAVGTLLFGGTLGMATAAEAGLQINAQFCNPYSIYYGNPRQTGGGVFSTTGSFWHVMYTPSISSESLYNAASQSTGVTFSQTMGPGNYGTVFASAGHYNGFGGTANEKLMNSNAYSTASASNPNTFVFAGLTAGTTFDLYVYTQAYPQATDGGLGRQMGMTVAGVTQIAAPGRTSDSTFILGVNYLKFSGITVGSDGKIAGAWWKVAGTSADWNGFQLIETAVVPGPGAVAIMGLAGVFSGRRRRA